MQCRSGIERCGATRTGYYFPNQVTTIAGVARRLLIRDLVIDDARPRGVATASFKAWNFIPTVGQEVILALGTIGKRLFGGHLIRVSSSQDNLNQSIIWDCECLDYSWKLNKLRVVGYWGNQSADSIVTSVMSTYAPDITYTHLVTGLSTIEYYSAKGRLVAEVLTDLANMIGGGWYVDDDADLHFYGSGGEPAGTYTAPAAITIPVRRSRTFRSSMTTRSPHPRDVTAAAQAHQPMAAGIRHPLRHPDVL